MEGRGTFDYAFELPVKTPQRQKLNNCGHCEIINPDILQYKVGLEAAGDAFMRDRTLFAICPGR